MNPEIKAKWVSALRSGDYAQCKGQLRMDESFCCLGVLCDLHSKEHKVAWNGYDYFGIGFTLPEPVQQWAGFSQDNPPAGKFKLATYNDGQNYPNCPADERVEPKHFPEIADLIEKHL